MHLELRYSYLSPVLLLGFAARGANAKGIADKDC